MRRTAGREDINANAFPSERTRGGEEATPRPAAASSVDGFHSADSRSRSLGPRRLRRLLAAELPANDAAKRCRVPSNRWAFDVSDPGNLSNEESLVKQFDDFAPRTAGGHRMLCCRRNTTEKTRAELGSVASSRGRKTACMAARNNSAAAANLKHRQPRAGPPATRVRHSPTRRRALRSSTATATRLRPRTAAAE